jgi:hypothetical protein
VEHRLLVKRIPHEERLTYPDVDYKADLGIALDRGVPPEDALAGWTVRSDAG